MTDLLSVRNLAVDFALEGGAGPCRAGCLVPGAGRQDRGPGGRIRFRQIGLRAGGHGPAAEIGDHPLR